MEERRIPIGLFAIVRELKSWRLEYKQEVNVGVVTCWLSENPGIWGEGATIDAALQDMLSVMRECAEECFSRSAAWAEDFVLLMLKVLFSSDDELLSCLDGKTCGDSLDRNGQLFRHGSRHDLYYYGDRVISVSRGSGEIGSEQWQDILKHPLHITQDEFNQGL